MNALTQSRRYVAVIVALSFAAALAPRVYAHHAFATEFDASLEGASSDLKRPSAIRMRRERTFSICMRTIPRGSVRSSSPRRG